MTVGKSIRSTGWADAWSVEQNGTTVRRKARRAAGAFTICVLMLCTMVPTAAVAKVRIVSAYDVIEDVASSEGALLAIGRDGEYWEEPRRSLLSSGQGRRWERLGRGGAQLRQAGDSLLTVRGDSLVSVKGRRVRTLTGLPGVAGADYYALNDVARNGRRYWAATGIDSDAVVFGKRTGSGRTWWGMQKVLPTEHDGQAQILLPDGKGVITLTSEWVGDAQWVNAWKIKHDGSRHRLRAPKADFVTDALPGGKSAVGGRHTWPVGSSAAYVLRRTKSGWSRSTIRAVKPSNIDTGSRLPQTGGILRTRRGLVVTGSVAVQRCGPYAPEDCSTIRTIPVLWHQRRGGGWRQQELGTGGYGHGRVEAVTVDDGHLVAVGAVWRGRRMNRHAAVWHVGR